MKIVTVVGARPQFIKAWPVSIALSEDGVTECVIHTGQHYDPSMSDIFFDEFGMRKPNYMLDQGGGSHGKMTGRMLEAVEKVLFKEEPDAVLVYGDTNSTLAGALAAVKIHIPVIHVEAGLRSRNFAMPEEQNRILTDHISSLLLCPTTESVKNLAAEGIRDKVHHIGDVMYDATLKAVEAVKEYSDIVQRLALEDIDYTVMTVHRAENTNTKEQLVDILNWVTDSVGSRQIILPAHPRIQSMLEDMSSIPTSIKIIDPLGYIDMAALMMNCFDVYTDSGGLQKEAYFHGKRCTTLRSETEWSETIRTGWNRLAGEEYACDPIQIFEYGEGDASRKVVRYLTQLM